MLKKFVSLTLCLILIVSVAVISFSVVSAADSKKLLIKCGDSSFSAEVGDKVTFAVDVTAERLFENVQAEIKYDSAKLKVTPVTSDDPDLDDWDVAGMLCIPSLVENGSAHINLKMENLITFNASRVAGYNFKNTRNLVRVEFTVVSGGETEIDFDILWMMIKGGEKGYFQFGVPEVTEGISIDTYVIGAEDYIPVQPTYPSYDYPATEDEAPAEIPDDAGVLTVFTDSGVYEVGVGERFRYDILIEAERLCETLQGRVDYPSELLKITRFPSPDPDISDWEYESMVVCPNVSSAVVNLGGESVVKYNASNIYGFNFREEKVLLTLEFTAIEAGVAEIVSTIEELIIKGGDDFYFDLGKPGTTDGLSIKYITNAKVCENPPERPTEPPVVYPTVEGNVVVHFDNYFNWNDVYCYTYVDGGDREDMGQWPGTPCEKIGDKDWTATIPGDCTHVIFNNGDMLSTVPMLNPLRERIAKRVGSAGHMVNGIIQYSYSWFDYDPNPVTPTYPEYPSYSPDDYPTYLPTELPWEEPTYTPTDTPWEDLAPDSPAYPNSPEWDPTLPPTAGGLECPSESPTESPEASAPVVKPTAGGVQEEPTGTDAVASDPKPTEGATSGSQSDEETSVDVPPTGINATAICPVLLIATAGMLLMLRKKAKEN